MFFEIAAPTRIIFGPGVIRNVAAEATPFGKKSFLVCGRSLDRCRNVMGLLEEVGCEVSVFQSVTEPTVEVVLEGLKMARSAESEFIIGVGGGSVIDTGKAISALLTNPGDLFEYLEVIGKGHPLLHAAAPYIAIPTTAGTGAEVTRNAVLSSPSHRIKVSLRSPRMLPRIALVDPELTYTLPAPLTASTGMDALTQLVEAYVSRKANPFTDSLCREGIRRVARSLRRAVEKGSDTSAREDMAIGSLFSGLALANAGLGAVHGLAGPLGGLIEAPHGTVCAALLPHVMRANVAALRCIDPASRALGRYGDLARILTGDASVVAEDAVFWIQELSRDLQIRPLSQVGLNETYLEATVENALHASSMKGNPVDLPSATLAEILRHAL